MLFRSVSSHPRVPIRRASRNSDTHRAAEVPLVGSFQLARTRLLHQPRRHRLHRSSGTSFAALGGFSSVVAVDRGLAGPCRLFLRCPYSSHLAHLSPPGWVSVVQTRPTAQWADADAASRPLEPWSHFSTISPLKRCSALGHVITVPPAVSNPTNCWFVLRTWDV